MAIVSGIKLVACQSAGNMHQQQRFLRTLIALYADAGHRLRQAFREMKKHFRLYRIRQMLALVINANVKTASGEIVAERRAEAAINKHHPPGVEVERQRVALRHAERRRTRNKCAA